MSWLWIFTIIFAVISILLFLFIPKMGNKTDFYVSVLSFFAISTVLLFTGALITGISVKKEMKRYEKERQQIEYQIENLTENKDKIKLNEWILTYNDWVNDVNTSKETYGWFSKYYNIDMSEHTVIDLV